MCEKLPAYWRGLLYRKRGRQMPDFDTRRPQEPDQPNRLHMFVVASKQHISAVGRWSKRTMIRHWRLGLSVSFLAVLAGTLTAWAVETHSEQVDQKLDWAVETPSEQLGQEIKLPPTPAYQDYYEDSSLSPVSSDGTECDVSEIGHYEEYGCHLVITKVTDPAELASITQELKADPDGGMGYAEVMEVEFFKPALGGGDLGNLYATSYCLNLKGPAIAALEFRAAHALRRHQAYLPRLVGRTDDCYVIVYEGMWHML